MKSTALSLCSEGIKRSPRGLNAESMSSLKRAAVVSSTGVPPIGAQRMPLGWPECTAASSTETICAPSRPACAPILGYSNLIPPSASGRWDEGRGFLSKRQSKTSQKRMLKRPRIRLRAMPRVHSATSHSSCSGFFHRHRSIQPRQRLPVEVGRSSRNPLGAQRLKPVFPEHASHSIEAQPRKTRAPGSPLRMTIWLTPARSPGCESPPTPGAKARVRRLFSAHAPGKDPPWATARKKRSHAHERSSKPTPHLDHADEPESSESIPVPRTATALEAQRRLHGRHEGYVFTDRGRPMRTPSTFP